jgi:hypothetical protein
MARSAHRQALVAVLVGSKDPEDYDLIVNATPIGMKDGDALPVDIDRIAPGAYVGDVVLKAEVTPFLRAAKDKGCTIQPGSDMLFEMIPACLEFFDFGSATPDELRATAQPSLWPRDTSPSTLKSSGGAIVHSLVSSPYEWWCAWLAGTSESATL